MRKISAGAIAGAMACVLMFASVLASAQMRRPQSQSNAGVIPSGTQLDVRLIDSLSSETANAGDTFRGTLQSPVVVNGTTVFPKGADVAGTVVSAKRSGRLSGPGVLELALTRVEYGSVAASVNVEPLLLKGESHTKSNTTKIGGGAAAGAIIGAITGGGKGAAVGAAVGAAAGTGAAAATGKRESRVDSEAILSWRTTSNSQAAKVSGYRTNSGYSNNTAARANDSVRNLDDDRDLQRREDAVRINDGRGWVPEFSARERRVIRGCMGDTRNLPPGLAKRDRLPPGLEKQLRRNGTLPPGLQKRVQALPVRCEQQLPSLPRAIQRVILNRSIILIDINAQSRILDLFSLDDRD
ncbi:MAG TPA: hypothetical protein VN622_06570 [Clostridia bacterium]|nr:hypothetical protein [Clostridia bacterium]